MRYFDQLAHNFRKEWTTKISSWLSPFITVTDLFGTSAPVLVSAVFAVQKQQGWEADAGECLCAQEVYEFVRLNVRIGDVVTIAGISLAASFSMKGYCTEILHTLTHSLSLSHTHTHLKVCTHTNAHTTHTYTHTHKHILFSGIFQESDKRESKGNGQNLRFVGSAPRDSRIYI